MSTAAYIFANDRHKAPREDALAWDDDAHVFIAADGVTRDWEAIRQGEVPYPDPSPATSAADAVARLALQAALCGDPLDRTLSEANDGVARVNDALGINGRCDYLKRDYAGAVAAAARIAGDTLEIAWIGDCGVAVIRSGTLLYLTRDHLDGLTAYLKENPAPFDDARRVYVRRDLRNKPKFYPEGRAVTYGVLTGEAEAIPYIETASIPLESGDVVATHTDGFRPYFALPEFLRLLSGASDEWDGRLREYTLDLASRDPGFGRERSIILYKHKDCSK